MKLPLSEFCWLVAMGAMVQRNGCALGGGDRRSFWRGSRRHRSGLVQRLRGDCCRRRRWPSYQRLQVEADGHVGQGRREQLDQDETGHSTWAERGRLEISPDAEGQQAQKRARGRRFSDR